MKEQQTQEPSPSGKQGGKKDSKPKSKSKSIEESSFSLVDTEESAIIQVDGDEGQLQEFFKDVVLPAEEETWLEAHPEHQGHDVPMTVLATLSKRFVITKCKVSLSVDDVVWRPSIMQT